MTGEPGGWLPGTVPGKETATPAHAVGAAAGTAIRAYLTVPCEARQVRAVREFVGETLGGHPRAEIPVLLASELAANSVLHSSPRPGGTMTVTVSGAQDGTVRVEVADAGGLSVPALRGGPGGCHENGRGLRLAGDLSARWGYRTEADGGLVTWFEVPFVAGTGIWGGDLVAGRWGSCGGLSDDPIVGPQMGGLDVEELPCRVDRLA